MVIPLTAHRSRLTAYVPMTVHFLAALKRARPDPGGGAVAAYGAALGLALLEKVVQLESQRPGHVEARQRFWEEQLNATRQLAQAMSHLQGADISAYRALARARKAPRKGQNLVKALDEAIDCPCRIMERAIEGLIVIGRAGEWCQRHLISDLLVAAEFLGAAILGAYHIAAANLPLVSLEVLREDWSAKLGQARQKGQETLFRVRTKLTAR